MKIDDLELGLVQVERTEEKAPLRSLLVRLITDTGLEGWGEGEVPWRPSELPGRRQALLAVLAGRSIFEIEELASLDVLKGVSLRSAVDMACWDLIGRALHQPLCHLWGGRYRQRIPLAVRLTGESPAHLTQLARELSERGFHAQTVWSCGQAARDLETLRAIRESTGGRVQLHLDGGGRYDLETARDLCGELEYEDLELFIDPIQTGDLHALASLARQTSVPMGAWRAIRSPTDVLAAVRWGTVPFVGVDLSRVGSIGGARKCAAVAEAGGVSVLLAGPPSLGIATAAMLQLAASTPAFCGFSECGYPQLQDDLLGEPLEIIDGRMTVPQGPGLGIEVDRAKVDRYLAGQ